MTITGITRMDASLDLPSIETITQIIANDLAGYSELLKILKEEREYLSARKFDEFTALLADKHQLLIALETNNKHRVVLLTQLKLGVNKRGILNLIELTPNRLKLNQDWAEINDLIDECSRLNQINAKIAHRAQATSHQILNILRGEPAGMALYGKTGAPSENGNALSITKA